jgi:Flp pilus assembly protein CpaB
MQPRAALVFLSLLLGLITFTGLAWITAVREGPRQGDERVTVLVAHTHMPYGAKLREPEDWFEPRALPRGAAPQHPVTRFDQLQDRYLARDLARGEAVDASYLLVKLVGLPLDKGRLAMAVQVTWPLPSDSKEPGSLVCVEHTRTNDATGGESRQTILENLLLLAINSQDTRLRVQKEWPDWVTLYVTPEEAYTLGCFQQAGGTLRLRKATGKERDPGPHSQIGGR